MWDQLPPDLLARVMDFVADGLVGYKQFPTPKENHAHLLRLARLSKMCAAAMKPTLDLYSTPHEPGHAIKFVDAMLHHFFNPRTGSAIKHMTTDKYCFFYTAVYTGCTRRPEYNWAGEYYRLLGHRLIALLQTRALPWKGVDALRMEFACMGHLFGYLNRFYIARRALPEVAQRLEACYLKGNPNVPEEPEYDNLDWCKCKHY